MIAAIHGAGNLPFKPQRGFCQAKERETTAEATRKEIKIKGGRSSEQIFNTYIF